MPFVDPAWLACLSVPVIKSSLLVINIKLVCTAASCISPRTASPANAAINGAPAVLPLHLHCRDRRGAGATLLSWRCHLEIRVIKEFTSLPSPRTLLARSFTKLSWQAYWNIH